MKCYKARPNPLPPPEFLAAGDSVDDVLAEYPALKREDVQACLDYASRLMANQYSVMSA